MTSRKRARRTAVLGAGAVGSALAASLAREGEELVLWSRSAGRAAALRRRLVAGLPRAAQRIRTARALGAALEGLGGADVVVLSVSDGAVASLARDCAEASVGARPPVALHTNGFLGLAALEPLAGAGWATGFLHPLAAVPPRVPAGARPLAGAWFAAAGEPRALRGAARIARAAGGRLLPLADGDAAPRALHAAAALLSGGLVALVDAALEVLGPEAGDEARAALLALAGGTLVNVAELGTADALTGPVARGAEELVRGHLALLAERDPALAALYRSLGVRMVALARERGSLDARAARRMARLLGRPRP